MFKHQGFHFHLHRHLVKAFFLSKICKAFSKAHNRKFKKLDLLPWFTLQVSETDDWTFVVEQDGWMMTVTRVSGKMLVDEKTP